MLSSASLTPKGIHKPQINNMKLSIYIKRLQEIEVLHGGDLECVRSFGGDKPYTVIECDSIQKKIHRGADKIVYV